MKHLIRLPLAALSLALASALLPPVSAQDATPPPAQQQLPTPNPAKSGPEGAAAARTPDQVVRAYSKRLSLTDDQRAKLKPIIADRQQQMLALRDDKTMPGREKLKKIKAVMDATDSRINAVLTPDQQKQYAAFEAEQKEKIKERHKEAGSGAN